MADPARFEPFYRERLAGLVRACALVTLDPGVAEEIAAEAFATVWQRWERMQDEDHAGGYAYTTAMRLSMKRATRRGREVIGAADTAAAPDEVGKALDRAAIFAALGDLPMRQRQAVVLRDWAGFETSQIATMVGMDASTVRVHLTRGRRRLRSLLRLPEESHD